MSTPRLKTPRLLPSRTPSAVSTHWHRVGSFRNMSVRKSWTDDRRLMLIEFTNPLNESELSFPVLECFHILGFIMLVGTTAVVDFRLLGVGMRRQTVADLAKNLAPWTLIGLVLVLLSGPLLFSSDPDMYYLNRAFQI